MDRTDEEDKQQRHGETDEKEIEELEKSRNEIATIKQTMWSVRCFQTWCDEKNLAIDFNTTTKSELNQALQQFYATVKNAKGEPYGFSSYACLRSGLNRYINDPPINRILCLWKDPEFTSSNNVFVEVIKKLRRERRDKTAHHPALTEADYNKIRHSPVLNPNTPEGLVNKVWFDVQLHMGRRAKKSNRQLKPDSFIIHKDEKGRKYATLDEFCTKDYKDAAGEINKICLRLGGFMFEHPGDPLCPVASLEKYLSLLPPDPPAFYLHPKRTNYSKNDWYTKEPMGLNGLGSMLPRICRAADTKTIYTNHCLRRSTVHKFSDARLAATGNVLLTVHSRESSLQNATEVRVMDRQEGLMGEHQNIQEEAAMNMEDTAECSEQLVIAKVEDLGDEIPVDVDPTIDHSEKKEVDKPENADKNPDKEIKAEVPAGTNPRPVLKGETKSQAAQPTVPLPVNIKDEPMDEEYEKASTPQQPIGNVKDEPDASADFNQKPDELKISAVFTVGGKSDGAPVATPGPVPTHPPLAPAFPIGVVCTGCKKVLLKGQTAFQRKGCSKLYCSPQCLCTASNLVVKAPQKKTCHCCHKEIVDLKEVLNAPDTSGGMKEFCSHKCLNASTFMCSVCQKTGVSYTHQVNIMGSIQKLCSEVCFSKFRTTSKLTMNSCMNCSGFCNSTDSSCPTLLIEGTAAKFCTQNCLTTFLKKSQKNVACKMCLTMRPTGEMVDSPNIEGIRELFCSASCVTANKVQAVSSSGAAVECNSCKKKQAPQYHLAMSDGTIQNFCSFSCVVSFQEALSKKASQNQVNTVTSTSNSLPTPIPAAAPKPASKPEPSSSKKTNAPVQTVTKIPCAQCLQSFYHKPDLLEYKRKMYAFCGGSCVEEFKKINNIMARCEYCKIDKVIKEVKRINKIDRSFCSEGCRLLYNHDLVKRWGKKHCRNCLYCNGSAQTLVNSFVGKKQEEFCGNACLAQYNLILRQEVKCTMCKQAKKMTETVNWLGEIKHFCTLQCLMFFCSLQGTTGTVTKAANKILPAPGTPPVVSVLPQNTVNLTPVGSKDATPVIAKVISLSGATNGQPGAVGNTALQASVPAATAKVKGHLSASTQTDAAKTPAPPPKILKNKALLCKPLTQNKGTSCKPNSCDADTQTDLPHFMVVPVPVPVYVPVPMNLYTQYTPEPFGLPLPIPVPLFFPTTLDSAESIVQTIQEIKEKIPNDPLEADLIMMAEMVAEDAERDKHTTPSDQAGTLVDDFDFEALSSNLSWEEDSVSSAQTWDQPPEVEKTQSVNPVTMTLIPTPTPIEEPQKDLEADYPVENIALLRGKSQEQEVSSAVKRRPRRKARDGFPQKKRARKSAAPVAATSAQDTLTNLSKLQQEYGVSAWKDWVHWRNSQPNMETPKFGSRSMTLKEDLLKCSTAELSYGLCKFIAEVRRPNGEKYSPDSIFYLCLGIQQHLFENERMENIFADICYTRFCQDVTCLLKEWKPTILPSGYVHSRIEEEYLWDCKQLGAFSPGVLLNTLLYFFTKYFNYKTVEQHRRLSFGHVIRCSRNKGSGKEGCLRFYPPKEEVNEDGVPAKRRKEDEDDRESVLEIKENTQNPLRCPVKLYEFYLSKCSPSVRQSISHFYLNPERSCVPCSPMWFSTSSLSDEALEGMLTRILTVRDLHLQEDQPPPESESDSDSD
ncbi:zinc finger MYM-type protein 4 isoform X2 [Misgurnus anguillicaudatus]|uniref:zinc finger MYM-type protein 4 isoform X2 n=1 Tax=Misgurnus anguillicaudatus TaxID=75329 RepID=UPI003CCF3435